MIVDEFDSLDCEAVRNFISEGATENLHLDFKTVRDDQLSSRDDRKNLAKAISGFANSEGGIIVWGVDARPNSDGIDCAVGEKPIANLKRFVSKLSEYSSQASSPLVDGVTHNGILSGGGSGFAATYVPQSDAAPHMAKLGEDRYYKRNAGSFYRLEHFDLEDMFGRRPHPKLQLSIKILLGSDPPVHDMRQYWDARLLLQIQNIGHGAAIGPRLSLKIPIPWCVGAGGPSGMYGPKTLNKLPQSPADKWVRFQGSTSDAVLGQTSLDVLTLTSPIPASGGVPAPFMLEYELSSANSRFMSKSIEFSSSDLVQMLLDAKRTE